MCRQELQNLRIQLRHPRKEKNANEEMHLQRAAKTLVQLSASGVPMFANELFTALENGQTKDIGQISGNLST